LYSGIFVSRKDVLSIPRCGPGDAFFITPGPVERHGNESYLSIDFVCKRRVVPF